MVKIFIRHGNSSLEAPRVSVGVEPLPSTTRQATSDAATSPVKVFIETVPTIGYRFVGECEEGQAEHQSPLDRAPQRVMKPDEAKNKITGPPLPNNEIMDALRKWKRRPGSCKDQVLIGVFEVDSCRAAEATCAQVIGIHVGDLVAVSLHTPTGDSEGADYEWIVATATRDVADVLEELADRNDRGPVLVQLRGFGVYTYKVDYPNLETGEMQYVRDPCPALLIESAQIRGYAADVLNH